MYRQSHRNFLILTSALSVFLAPGLASALPTGGAVSAGTATISTSKTATTVTQTSPNAVINWTGFNTTSGQQVNFNDSSNADITLNRVSGGATSFDGTLYSNGNVWVLNSNGILFGPQALVQVGGLLASTSAITDSNFMAGKYNFTPGGGAANATVTNQGDIITGQTGSGTIAQSGLAALVAPSVANSGSIEALSGKITLASGDTYTLDLAGDGLINLAASKAVTQQLLSNSGALISTSGTGSNITGGTVTLTAAQATNLVDSLINLDGVVEASNLTVSGANIDYNAQFNNGPGKGTVTFTAPGNIYLEGGQLGRTQNPLPNSPINVSLNSTGSGTVTVGEMAVNTNGGNLSISADNPVAQANGKQGISGNVILASPTITTNGGAVSIFSGNSVSATGNINAGNVSIEGASSNSLSDDTFGVGAGGLDIASTGNINIVGYAPQGASVSTTGVNIGTSQLKAAGTTTITGIGGATTNGSSTPVLINDADIEGTKGITINGYDSNVIGSVVKGNADGVVIESSDIGSTDAASTVSPITITGEGGNAAGYSAEGILLVQSEIGSGNGTLTLNGTGGTGVSTIGVDLQNNGIAFGPSSSGTPAYGKIVINGQGGTSSSGGADAGVNLTYNGSPCTVNCTTSPVYGYPSSAFYSYLQAATIDITGKAGSGTNSSNGAGVYVTDADFDANAVSLTGQGGSGTGSNNYGVRLAGNNTIVAGGPVVIKGTGVGSAADIQADESAAPVTNSIELTGNGSVNLDGTRGELNLKNLTVSQLQ